MDAAIEINQAILDLDPGSELAATRLGIGLLNAERHEEAIAVFEAALVAHPDNTVAAKRLLAGPPRRRDRRRPQTAPPPQGPDRPRGLGQGDGLQGRPAAKPGQLTWVSDAGILDHNGRRKFRDNGQPWGEPTWRIGDQVGLYIGGAISVLVEIAARPVFDPSFVASQNSGLAEDGERWPCVTRSCAITTLPADSAPTLEDLNIPASSMPQRARKQLDPTQSGTLLGAYGRS